MEVLSGRQGRELGQDLRPRPRRAGGAGRPESRRRSDDGARRRERRHVPHQGAVEPRVPHRPRRSAPAGTSASADVAGRDPDGRRRQGVHADDRGREDVRHHPPLARAAAGRRAGDPRHPGRRRKQSLAVQPSRRAGHARQRRARRACRRPARPLPLPGPDRQRRQRRSCLVGAPPRRLADLVTPLNAQGQPDESASFVRPGASTIYREQGKRLIAVKFERPRPRPGRAPSPRPGAKVAPLVQAPYRTEWSGEFQQMEEAEAPAWPGSSPCRWS